MELVSGYIENLESARSIDKRNVETVAAFKPVEQRGHRQQLKNGHARPCNHCGRIGHRDSQCRVLEKGLKCNHCGKVSHLSMVCQSCLSGMPAQPSQPAFTFQPETSENDDNHHVVLSLEVTPRLPSTIFHQSGSFTFRVFPDTGGAASIISRDLALKNGIPFTPCDNIPDFQAVNGTKLSVDGIAQISILNDSNNETIRIYVFVSGDFSNEFVVGYRGWILRLFRKHFRSKDLNVRLSWTNWRTNYAQNILM